MVGTRAGAWVSGALNRFFPVLLFIVDLVQQRPYLALEARNPFPEFCRGFASDEIAAAAAVRVPH